MSATKIWLYCIKKKAPNGIVGLNNDESPRFKEVPDH